VGKPAGKKTEDLDIEAWIILKSILKRLGGRGLDMDMDKWRARVNAVVNLKADSHIACRARAVPLPFRAAKGLECVFPI